MIIAGTGHRPAKLGGFLKGAAHAEWFARGVRLARAYLEWRDASKVISGMALGWDQMLAQAALDAGIPLIAAVPFKGQDTVWHPRDRALWVALCERAAEIVQVSPGGFSNAKLQRRNEWMVDRCDRIVSLWDGTAGGTANCINYATVKHVPYDNLYQVWRGRVDFQNWARQR